MNLAKVLTVVSTLFVLSTQASAMILPRNHLDALDDPKKIANIDEKLFNEISNKVVAIWQPIAQLHGATLTAVNLWNDSTVNAYADQAGNQWKVHMFGGLARRPEVTPDGFALVVCHELGHHFGGYYFYEGGNAWASAEGEADYWATQVCARKIFGKSPRNARFRMMQVPKIVKDKCDASWKENAAAQDECYRIAAGGQSLANLLAALGGGVPKFETPDPRVVAKTNTAHPQSQCRLDTYFNGALCPIMFDPRVIPGKTAGGGSNSKEAELEATKSSCFASAKMPVGNRPLCWFKPQL